MGDAAAVAAIVNERELLDRGVCETTVAAVRAQWTAPEIELARPLLGRAFATWRAHGIGRAELTVASDNPGAERLYRRLGMEFAFTQDRYERPLESQRKGAYLEHGASSALD